MKTLLLGDNHERCKNYEEVLDRLNIEYNLSLNDDYSKFDSLIIPGGIDVDPALYNQEKDPTVIHIDRAFDDIQLKAIDYFVKNNKPILGICRGMQLLNVYFGGTLVQNIDTDIVHSIPDHKDAFHEIENDVNSFMYDLYGERCIVNSLHHQSVNQCGKGIIDISKSSDGIIEAARHISLPIMMFQFHPERMALNRDNDTVDGIKIFNMFFGLK